MYHFFINIKSQKLEISYLSLVGIENIFGRLYLRTQCTRVQI